MSETDAAPAQAFPAPPCRGASMGLAGRDPTIGLISGHVTAGARIERSAVRIAGPILAALRRPAGDCLRDIPAGAETRIDPSPLLQPQEGGMVIGEVLRLPSHGSLP